MNIQTSGQVNVNNLPPNAAQETGGNLATVANAQGTSGTGIVQPTGGGGILGWLSGIYKAITGTIQVSATALDNTVLDTQATVTSTGYGNTYNTDGYGQISFEFSGNWEGVVTIEGSNGGTNYYPLIVRGNDDTLSDTITSAGTYTVTPTTQYVKYNIRSIVGTAVITVLGKAFNSAPVPYWASQTTDNTSGVQTQVNVAGGIGRDVNSNITLSDAPVPIQIQAAIGTNVVIDTKGYQSFSITTQALAGNIFASDDQITWTALSGAPRALGALVTAVAANTGYTFPCLGRFIRIAVTTAGAATLYLRNQPWQANYTTTVPSGTAQDNISQWGGTAVVTGGVAGIPAVGGNIAVGVAPTANPVVAGAIDTGGLTRRILSDTSGRPIIAALGSDGVYRPLYELPAGIGAQNIPAQYTALADTIEGSSIAVCSPEVSE